MVIFHKMRRGYFNLVEIVVERGKAKEGKKCGNKIEIVSWMLIL